MVFPEPVSPTMIKTCGGEMSPICSASKGYLGRKKYALGVPNISYLGKFGKSSSTWTFQGTMLVYRRVNTCNQGLDENESDP